MQLKSSCASQRYFEGRHGDPTISQFASTWSSAQGKSQPNHLHCLGPGVSISVSLSAVCRCRCVVQVCGADLPLDPLNKNAFNSFETFPLNPKTKNEELSAVVRGIQQYLGQREARRQSACSTPCPKDATPISRKSGRHCTEVHAEHGSFSAGKH